VREKRNKKGKILDDCLERVIKREEENLEDCDNSDLLLAD
jgi:hypothetical protein